MHVGRELARIVQGGDAQEAEHTAAAIIAPQRRKTGGAAIDIMRAAAVGLQREYLWPAGEDFDVRGFDQRVDREGATRLPLAIAAMTAMHEHRRRRQPVTHRATETGAGRLHPFPP